MHLREGEFEKAHTDFFEAFKNYDESGSPRRTTCLKYLVLANMLMKSGINPFDSQEVCGGGEMIRIGQISKPSTRLLGHMRVIICNIRFRFQIYVIK